MKILKVPVLGDCDKYLNVDHILWFCETRRLDDVDDGRLATEVIIEGGGLIADMTVDEFIEKLRCCVEL